MKHNLIISLIFVCLEVEVHSKRVFKELTFKSEMCDSPYSCTDCYTARICRTDSNGGFRSFVDIKCSPRRPYCDHFTGTCVSERPRNCGTSLPNSLNDIHDNTCKSIFACQDCKTARICKPTSNGLVPFKDLPCTGETPYCDSETGSCGTQPSLGCGKKDDFVCMQDGTFPDSNCYVYHHCSNLSAVTFTCPKPNEHYDPKMGRCSDTVPCQSFSCLDNLGMKIPHPLDARYFALCGEKEPIVIDLCPTPYELNVTSQRCEATCHYNGLLRDINDCRFYYKCTQNFLTQSLSYFVKERKQCPEGQAFDPTQYLCVSDISSIPGCKVNFNGYI